MAITSLVFGIAAVPALCFYAVPGIALGATALVLGQISLRKIRESGGTVGGFGCAQAGWITGLVAALLGAAWVVFWVLFFTSTFTGAFLQSHPTPSQ